MGGSQQGALAPALLLATGAAAAGAGFWGWQEGRQPNAFLSAAHLSGPFDASTGAPLEVGETTYWGMSLPDTDTVPAKDDGRRVLIDEAAARVVLNSADAEVTLIACDPLPEAGLFVNGGETQVLDMCARMFPVLDEPLRLAALDSPPDQILMVITPRRPGAVLVNGLELTYSYGGRDGTQLVGEAVQVGCPEPEEIERLDARLILDCPT